MHIQAEGCADRRVAAITADDPVGADGLGRSSIAAVYQGPDRRLIHLEAGKPRPAFDAMAAPLKFLRQDPLNPLLPDHERERIGFMVEAGEVEPRDRLVARHDQERRLWILGGRQDRMRQIDSVESLQGP